MTPIPDYPLDRPILLPATGSWPASVHRFDADSEAAVALRAAEAAGRPLLIRGDPGTGKSQTARAAAAAAGRLFLPVTIDGRTEAHDLLWRFDAVARLSDAQAGGKAESPAHYLTPGPLWWAYAWASAEDQWGVRRQGGRPQRPDEDWTEARGTVLLIDEIDKADPDLPNALLEVLGNQGFTVPHRGDSVYGDHPPLVVITTNEERELPSAFLRRCLVLTLRLPANLVPWLVGMGELHLERRGLKDRCYPEVLAAAAGQLERDRAAAQGGQRYAPGLAEYLDLVVALANLDATEAGQTRLLGQVARFALVKAPP